MPNNKYYYYVWLIKLRVALYFLVILTFFKIYVSIKLLFLELVAFQEWLSFWNTNLNFALTINYLVKSVEFDNFLEWEKFIFRKWNKAK